MTIDVVVPSIRTQTIDRLLYSFRWNTVWPDRITIVSNEIADNIHVYGLPVRVLRFRSQTYPIGDRDVVLRRNIGIFHSDCSHIITFDDDQVAPIKLIEDCRSILGREPFFWGHYRYISFADHPLERLLQFPPEAGRTREHPPNAWHGWASSYAGLFGAEAGLLRTVGGFDMIYCGRHGGEDQDLGRRLAARQSGSDRVFVHEPPFAWHPTDPAQWSPPAYSNLCLDGHDLGPAEKPFQAVCRRCPYFEPSLDLAPSNDVILRYDPECVEVEEHIPPIL